MKILKRLKNTIGKKIAEREIKFKTEGLKNKGKNHRWYIFLSPRAGVLQFWMINKPGIHQKFLLVFWGTGLLH